MKRKDRLIEIIDHLRDGTLHRAQDLAAHFGVSERTIYRDMEALIAAGVPIEGERGVGYMATAAITLPPLNLTKLEFEALHFGLALVAQMEDADLANAADNLSAKIDAALPEDRRGPLDHWGYAASPLTTTIEGFRHMPLLRNAIRAMQKVEVTKDGHTFVLRPLGMDYWGRVWTLTAWDDGADTFVSMRLDHMQSLRPLPASFVDEPGKTLADYNASPVVSLANT
ncbi:MAG: helix-turn-helix transcriptional regulator [Planktomarina sp.]